MWASKQPSFRLMPLRCPVIACKQMERIIDMRGMVDLESAIRNADTRPHFHEAVLAYQSGAYRASIVEAWVAVVLDLIEKIMSLAEGGDAKAQRFASEFKEAISKGSNGDITHLQHFERDLLTNALSLNMITQHEKDMLERLRDDRNHCAHPSYSVDGEVFAPSAELAQSHLALAIDYCLSLPAAPGREIAEQFQKCVDSFSWPSDSDLPVFLKNRFLNRVRDSTKRGLIELIVKQAVIPPSTDELQNVTAHTYAGRCRRSLNAIYRIDDSLVINCVQNVLRKKRDSRTLDEDTLLRFVGVAGHIQSFWLSLEDDELMQVKALLKNRRVSAFDRSIEPFTAGLGTSFLVDLDVFASGYPADRRVVPAYSDALTRLQMDPFGTVDMIERSTYGVESLFPVALECLRRSKKFSISEHLIRGLLALSDDLSAGHIRELGTIILGNEQVLLAPDIPTYLDNLYYASSSSSDKKIAWSAIASELHEAYAKQHPDEDAANPFSDLLEKASDLGI